METNVSYTVVGAFVILLSGFIALSLIWLSSGFSVETYDIYKVYMKESVSGLSVDASVEYNGVNVGTVKDIEISKRDPKLVDLLLRVKSSTPITEGTRATMNMRGVTGVTFIALLDKGTDKKILVAKKGEEYPVIATTPSLLTRFDIALNQLNTNFQNISTAIQSLLDEENIKSIKYFLADLRAATQQLKPILETGFNTIQVFNTQTLPATNQAMANLDNIMNNIAEITTEMKRNPSVLIRGRGPQTLGPGEK